MDAAEAKDKKVLLAALNEAKLEVEEEVDGEDVEEAVKAYETAVEEANKAIVKYNKAVASAEDYKEYKARH